ncbi:unnamed protein product [Rotaria magnacalcarata]|uniref:Uncharacterized protein n=2 Tax=Rotaria magnacalcarata TaxID=392030 RepID=A0A814VT48_9BILA|nr:unnamed protein product [Rotaria magnacalcarata]CAF1448483.1 unnamed protein product [Rotaria magnacalcarata]CAF2120142.1 unnamed protein product [Rotaria magnacalcarata]CAF4451290.1 unnamed protein product [Rotaria magnacalcarata]CAF5143918.1 unnamed protein product [Rotaria magnacalcarata]
MQVHLIVLALLCLYIVSATVPYPSTCDPAADGVVCSNSIYCKCLALLDGGSVCSQEMSHDYATPCNATNPCQKSGTYCVIETRDGGGTFCHEAEMFGTTLCPPVIASDIVAA